jgi:hypothetical protein
MAYKMSESQEMAVYRMRMELHEKVEQVMIVFEKDITGS